MSRLGRGSDLVAALAIAGAARRNGVSAWWDQFRPRRRPRPLGRRRTLRRVRSEGEGRADLAIEPVADVDVPPLGPRLRAVPDPDER